MVNESRRDRISFRIRKIDEDLAAAIAGIDSETLSELCRDGLRIVLGIRTTKRVEVTERELPQIDVPQFDAKKTVEAADVRTKPAVWIKKPSRLTE